MKAISEHCQSTVDNCGRWDSVLLQNAYRYQPGDQINNKKNRIHRYARYIPRRLHCKPQKVVINYLQCNKSEQFYGKFRYLRRVSAGNPEDRRNESVMDSFASDIPQLSWGYSVERIIHVYNWQLSPTSAAFTSWTESKWGHSILIIYSIEFTIYTMEISKPVGFSRGRGHPMTITDLRASIAIILRWMQLFSTGNKVCRV